MRVTEKQPMNEGTRVFDREDDDPDEAVIVHRPAEKTIADWEYEINGETYTTAESNPGYDPDEPLVVLSFLDPLTEEWPDWESAPSAELFDGVRERGIDYYGFPESRLTVADEATDTVSVPEEFETITDRLEENGFEVTEDAETATLTVEKYGTEYIVRSDGSVEGEEGLRNRVVSIVNRYL